MQTPERDSPLADLETSRLAAVRRPEPRPWLVLAGASAVGLVVLAIVLVLVNTIAANLVAPASSTSVAVLPSATPKGTPTAPSGSAPTPIYPTYQPGIPPIPATYTPQATFTPEATFTPQATFTPSATYTPYPTYTPFPTPTLPATLPYPWQSQDVGIQYNPGVSSYNYGAGVYTVRGSGGDIWGGYDQFQYMAELGSGDMRVVAHVTSLTPTDGWTKAGVMMRYSLDPSAPYVYEFVTPQNGIDFQFRTSTGADSGWTANIGGTAPYWVMLTRQGNVFTGYASQDGQKWQEMNQVSIDMPQGVLVGFALTSHNSGQYATAQMDYMNVSPYSGG